MLPVNFQQFLLSHNLTLQQFHCSTAKGRLFGGGLFSFYFFTKWSSHLFARCGRISFVNVGAAGIANTLPEFRMDFFWPNSNKQWPQWSALRSTGLLI
jgi:hypothetical protein